MSKNIPHLDDTYPPALAYETLDKPYTLTVHDVEFRTFYSQFTKKEEDKYVLSFKNAKSVLICSPAIAKRVGDVLGRDPNQWKGQRITLFQGVAKNGKRCIDARAPEVHDSEDTTTLDQAALDQEYEEVFGE